MRNFLKAVSFFLVGFSLQCIAAERSFQILAFQPIAGAPTEAQLYVNGELGEEIEVLANRFGKTYQVAGDGDMLLHLTDKVVEEPEQLKAFPGVKIPKSWTKILLVAFPDPKNKNMPFRILPINAAKSEFGPGEFLFFNLSDSKFAGTVGNKKLALAEKKMKIVRDFAEDNKDFRMKLNSYDPKAEKKVRPFTNKLIRYDESLRLLFFVYSSKNTKRFTYQVAEISGL